MITIYHTDDQWTEYQIPSVISLVCHEQGINCNEVTDLSRAMRLAGGTIKPHGSFIGHTFNNVIIRDVFDLVHWIEQNGLKRV